MKRRVIVFLMTLILVTGMAQLGVTTALAADTWDGTTDTTWYNKDIESYTLTTGAQLAGLAKLVNEGATESGGAPVNFSGVTITLGADIDLGGHQWTPIGIYTNKDPFINNPFNGTFDGNGYTISNLAIGTSDSPENTLYMVGLFGEASGGSFKNLNIESAGIYSIYPDAYVGALVGEVGHAVENCSASGNVTGGSSYAFVGGLVSFSTSELKNCHASCNVVCGSDSYAGGLIAQLSGGSITDSYATGDVTGSSYAGGLVGDFYGTLSNCYATGNVICSGAYGGGLAGYIGTPSSVSGCYATGDVTASGKGACVGGFVGYTSGTADGCFAIGDVQSSGDGNPDAHPVSFPCCVGGFVGYSEHTITRCFASGNVTSTGWYVDIGGFVGFTDNGTIGDCYAAGSVSSGNQGDCLAGGFAGSNAKNIQTSYARGAVSGSGTDTCVGGFAGNNGSGATLRSCYFDTNDSGLTGGIGLDVNSQTVTGLAPVQMTGSAASGNMTVLEFTAVWTAKANDLKWYFSQLKIFAESTDDAIKAASLESVSVTPFTVSFNSGSGSAVAPEYGYYTAVDKPADPTRPNHSFEGWYTTSGFTSAYDFSTAVTANITLFAKWKINSFTLGYDANGGSGAAPASVTQDYNTTVAAADGSGITRTGYTFSGWNTKADGSGKAYAAGASFIFTGNTTLYAQWSINSCTLGYDVNGGSGAAPASVTQDYNTTVAAADGSGITRANYTFAGWNTKADGSGTAYAAGASFIFTENTTLYAQWKINSCTLGYDVNGGSGAAPASVTQDYNTTVAAADGSGITRANYTFAGWNTKADGSGTAYAAGASFIFTGNTTLYAQWQYSGVNITAAASNANGSVSGGGTYGAGASVTLTATANAGYYFAGWYEGGALVSASPAYTFNVSGARSLTAQFDSVGIPASISAAAASYNKINVSWGAVPGAKGYQLYRAESPAGEYKLIKTLSKTSYVNTGLNTGTTYYYKVKAYVKIGSKKVYGSYFSPASSATPVLGTVTGPVAKANDPAAVKITWKAVAGKSKYEVWRSTSPDGGFALVKAVSGVSFRDSGLAPNTTYYYMIRAYRMAGRVKVYGEYSPVVSAKPVLAQVTGAKAARANASGIKLSWKPVTGRTKYEIWTSDNIDGTYTLLAETSSAGFKHKNLTAGVTYCYKIRAYRLAGGVKVYGDYSSAVSAKP